MKKVLLVLAVTVVSIVATAQTPSWQWGRRGGGSSDDKIVDMQTDKAGNVYIFAQLDAAGDENLDIDSTTGGKLDLSAKTNGHSSACLMSYSFSGTLRWAKVFSSSNGSSKAAGMGIDSMGRITVAVAMNGPLVYIDTDTTLDISIIDKTFQVIQYDTAGHYKWVKSPTPDTVSYQNSYKFQPSRVYTMPNGDSYIFCFLGKGLLSGSSGLVCTQEGLYMLKYNAAGVAKELIKLDMDLNGSVFDYWNFSVTKSRKFLFTGIRGNHGGITTNPIVGGQQVKHHVFLCCFSPTGSVLWRVENKDSTSGGVNGKPYIDDSKGLIYIAGGGIKGWANGDSLSNTPFINIFTNAPQGSAMPFFAVLDTLGSVIYLKNGSINNGSGSALVSITKTNNNKLFGGGGGGGIEWGSFKFDGGIGIGSQTFMPSFDATTGNILSMDSLRGNSSNFASVITADNNNNIYVGGIISSNLQVGSQNLHSAGGSSDFFVAKFGYVCVPLPLTMVSYKLLMVNEKQVMNIWTTASEINVSRFNVQRSTNGKDFTTVGVVMAKNKAANEYNFVDGIGNWALGISKVYYRIESIDYDGAKQYSEIRNIEQGTRNNELRIYPNPAKDVVHINCVGMKEVNIINGLGQVVYKSAVDRQPLTVNIQQFTKGLYIVQIITPKNEIHTTKLVVE